MTDGLPQGAAFDALFGFGDDAPAATQVSP